MFALDNEEENLGQEFFYLLRKLAKEMSFRGLVLFLRSSLANHKANGDNYENITDLIIDCVVEYYKTHNVKREDLFKMETRGKTTEAYRMATVLIHEHVEINHKELSNLFGRKAHTTSNNIVKEFKNMRPDDKNPQIREFIKDYNSINERVKPEIKKIKVASPKQQQQ